MFSLLRLILYTLPLAFLAMFFLYPLANILRVSFWGQGQWALEQAVGIVGERFFWKVLWFTLWQATASTALTFFIGLPLAWIFARYRFPGKSIIKALTTLPFVMPTVVVAAAFTTLLGNNGLLNRGLVELFTLDAPPLQLLNTVWIILLAHAFYNVSVVVRTVGGFWANLNPRLSEAAMLLGANGWYRLLHITLPLLMPSMMAAALLVFLFCFTSFGVVLILGGVRFATLEVEIYRQAVTLFNLPVAALLSLIQLVLTFIVMTIYTRLQARASVPLEMRATSETEQAPNTLYEWLFLGGALLLLLIILLAPLLALAWQSFAWGGDGPTTAYYRELTVNRRQSAFFAPPIVAIRNSLFYAIATMGLSLLLGLSSAYLLIRKRGWVSTILDPIFLLPLGTSAVTLGFGYIISMGSLRTSIWLVPVAHTLIASPFVIRTFLPALRGLDPRLREAAAVMGASPWHVWREIDAPILLRAMLVSAAFAFTISLGEFGATLLIGRPDMPTMPLVIYRALGQPGLLNFGQALAMSTILMVITTLGLLLIERFRLQNVEEF